MHHKIKWKNLLNETRRKPTSRENVKLNDDNDPNLIKDHRNEFERDYDRIMGSSSLRRLQDKAQVYPLEESDFIRTRLTHSMEVSAIARSFGSWLEKWLSKKNILDGEDMGKIPPLLATAGLVHDIGNPPFGHYGEDVIKNWFNNYFTKNKDINLTKEQQNDFLAFDGNAQGIRVLTRLQFLNDKFGINFTYGTLSSLIKYPWDSSDKTAKSKKKFGYFQQDKEVAEKVIKDTVGNINKARNPLTFFLEASDDIAYYGADVEDGVKKKIIPWDKIFEERINNEDSDIFSAYEKELTGVLNRHRDAHREKKKDPNRPDPDLTSVQNFKVWAQGQMISEVKQVFIDNYDKIMNGRFKTGDDLLDLTPKAYLLKDFFQQLLIDYCFPNKEVLSLELVGDSILNDLLETFIEQCVMTSSFEDNHKTKAGKLKKMISDNFIYVHEMKEDGKNEDRKVEKLSDYSKLLLITDFISGMTDSYAVDLHQKLKGVKMP